MPHSELPTLPEALAVNTSTAAALIDSTEATLEKDRATGHLGVPFVRAGRRIIYPIADLNAWLNANRVVPSTPRYTEVALFSAEDAE
jgi:sorbitol-specific phosphotransferase system component IIBC